MEKALKELFYRAVAELSIRARWLDAQRKTAARASADHKLWR
jgi:hypothetical protein